MINTGRDSEKTETDRDGQKQRQTEMNRDGQRHTETSGHKH